MGKHLAAAVEDSWTDQDPFSAQVPIVKRLHPLHSWGLHLHGKTIHFLMQSCLEKRREAHENIPKHFVRHMLLYETD